MVRKLLVIACMLLVFPTAEEMLVLDSTELRQQLATQLSDMFASEVPEYKEFREIVYTSNLDGFSKHSAHEIDKLSRIIEEIHGAIRVGTAEEMHMMTRIFKVFGMYPVNFYDLTQLPSGALPIIATAFRPIDDSIDISAFRIFCSMLHPSYISGPLEGEIKATLAHRGKGNAKFSKKLRTLLGKSEKFGLSSQEGKAFVAEVVKSLKLNRGVAIPFDLYKNLRAQNDVFADIVCLGINVNHLTPRAVDIKDATKLLTEADIPMKYGGIEGPKIRAGAAAVLLNQTSRQAPGEVLYVSNDQKTLSMVAGSKEFKKLKAKAPKLTLGTYENISSYLMRVGKALNNHKMVAIEHKARFGEIESRGVALTEKGEELYYRLQAEGKFEKEFPHTHMELCKQGLAYYRVYTQSGTPYVGKNGKRELMELVHQGVLRLVPVTYEDFLAKSAAGIFKSNMTTGTNGINEQIKTKTAKNRKILEEAMQREILDSHKLYKRVANLP